MVVDSQGYIFWVYLVYARVWVEVEVEGLDGIEVAGWWVDV